MKKVAIVTGGAKGIGKSIAYKLLENNFNVVVWDNDEQALSELEKSEFFYQIQCDLLDESQIALSLIKTLELFKRVDVLINNAGILYSEPLINIIAKNKRHSVENWKNVIDINLTAPFVVGSFVAEHMIMRRINGVIVNISSISAKGNAGQSAYSAAKAGLESMTIVWSKELGSFGIRCVAIAPGFIETEAMYRALSGERIEELKQQNPLKRLGKDENISSTVLFAINNDYVNGCVIGIDGGLIL
jgi:3-oxoacyl-[acyl-carrier protein] reductase